MAAACGLALSATALPAAAAGDTALLAPVGSTVTDDPPLRTIVTTDPELDDLNSMLRMLLYSNEIQIDGLVYASGQHHYKGDPDAGIEPHRWPAEGDTLHIDTAVNAYEEVYDNLVVHDPNYPTPAELRSKIAVGNITMEGEMEADTPGSDLIRDTLLEDNDDTIFLQVWGGPSTVARALKSIEEEYSETEDWAAIQEHVSTKAIITAWGHQDQTFREYIRPNWPDIEFREVSTSIWGYGARGATPPGTEHYLEPEWMSENVSAVGPLGREYRVWGDGKQMAAGFDDEDYFGLSGYTADELREMGYMVWTPPQPQGAWISEGDSSNFALLIDNGLRNYEHPSYGGWGGRQTQNAEDPNYWANRGTQDANEAGEYPADYPAARWFEAFHLDFAARLQWSVTDTYEDANHHPEATVAEGLDLTVHPGREVALTGSATDPDGDDVTLEWWQYEEAGTYDGAVELTTGTHGGVTFTVPADAEAGDTIHLILEVTDDGEPTLVDYQRVVLTVGQAPAQRYGFFLSDDWSGTAHHVFQYGRHADEVLIGDWDGNGTDTITVRRENRYYVNNHPRGGPAESVFTYGRADDVVLVGDWNGDGVDTLAVRRGATYHVKNSLRGGDADHVIVYGRAADDVVVGDWDGNGTDTFAVRRGATYHVKNTMSGGDADVVFTYGRPDDVTLAGDWDGNGTDTFAIRRDREFHVKNSLRGGPADFAIVYGRSGDDIYVGDWNGDGKDTLGVRRTPAS